MYHFEKKNLKIFSPKRPRENVWGSGKNVSPGPAVALDGPAVGYQRRYINYMQLPSAPEQVFAPFPFFFSVLFLGLSPDLAIGSLLIKRCRLGLSQTQSSRAVQASWVGGSRH